MDRNEVRFELGTDDLAAIRFGISPGHELGQAIAVLQRPNRQPLHWSWLRTVQPRIPEPAFRFMKILIGPTGYFPDFLTTPPTWDMTAEDELAALSTIPSAAIRADLDKLRRYNTGRRSAAAAELMARPADTRRRLVLAWQQMWDALLAPYWDAMRALLMADIAIRSRQFALTGLADTVGALHERVTWQRDAVVVRMQSWHETVACHGRGLLLVPSILGHPYCRVLTEKPAQPTLFYPVQGLGERWPQQPGHDYAVLAAVLGEGRARVLGCLDRPRTTSDTAAVAELARSTTSHHLTQLRNARLVVSTRDGARVWHSRTILGDTLVAGG